MSSCGSFGGIPTSAKMPAIKSLASQLANFGVMVDAGIEHSGLECNDLVLPQIPRCTSSENTLHTPIAPSTDRQLRMGDQFLGFLLKRNLTVARGCQVWVARPPVSAEYNQKTVVLKVTSKAEEKAYKRSRREAHILKIMKHPFIIKCYEVVQDDDFHVMVLEHVVGCDLYDRVGSKHFTTSDEFPYFHQIASAIAYAHRKGITHRDLKPENIVVSANGKYVKVIDFGLGYFHDDAIEGVETDYAHIPTYQKEVSNAKANFPNTPKPLKYVNAAGLKEKSNVVRKDSDVSSSEFLFARRKREFTLCGTEAYLAPEVKRFEKAYDPRKVDMWGLGAILYFMVYRRPLFMKDERKMHLPPFQFAVEKDITDLLRGLLCEPEDRVTMGRLQFFPYWTRNSTHIGYPIVVDQRSADEWLASRGMPTWTLPKDGSGHVTRCAHESGETKKSSASFEGVPSSFAQQNLWENAQIAAALNVELPCPQKKRFLDKFRSTKKSTGKRRAN